MKKELVAYKDIYGYWACVFNILLTQGKDIIDSNYAINLIKENYPEIANDQFLIEDTEIYVLTNNLITPYNDPCAINNVQS